jgi:adenylate cyclase, class 2
VPPNSRTKREIEIKLRVDDVPAILGRLRLRSAARFARVFEQNTLYDTRDSEFRRRGWLLRLRTETPARLPFARAGVRRAVLTFKDSAGSGTHRPSHTNRYKDRLEREVLVRHPNRWPELLASIGLHPAFRYEKYRSEERLNGLHLCLDETPLGAFLELEGPPPLIDRVAESLGYSAEDYIQGTYWDLYVADARRRGRPVTNMIFRGKKSRRNALSA